MLARFENGWYLEVIHNEEDNMYEFIVYDKMRNKVTNGWTGYRSIEMYYPMNEIDYILEWCDSNDEIYRLKGYSYQFVSYHTMKDFRTYCISNNNLTKKEAIEEHRKMWNWIADKLENLDEKDRNYHNTPYYFKAEYCGIYEWSLFNNCFCCAYDAQISLHYTCQSCPLKWGTEEEAEEYFCEKGLCPEDYECFNMKTEIDETTGLWQVAERYATNGNYKKAAEYARMIANLPERENKKYDYYFLKDK